MAPPSEDNGKVKKDITKLPWRCAHHIRVIYTVNGMLLCLGYGCSSASPPPLKEQCRLDMRKYSFSHRVINERNKLRNDCVNDSSVNMFKNRIDIYLIRAGYT